MEIASEKELKEAEVKVIELKAETEKVEKAIQDYNNKNKMPVFEGDGNALRSHLNSGCEDGDLLEIDGVVYEIRGMEELYEYGWESASDAITNNPFKDFFEGESLGILIEKK